MGTSGGTCLHHRSIYASRYNAGTMMEEGENQGVKGALDEKLREGPDISNIKVRS